MALSLPTGPRLSLSMPRLRSSDRSASTPRSSAERMWILAGAAAGFVLLLVGYFLLIGPQRSTTASVRTKVSDAQAQSAGLQNHIDQLRSEYTNLPKYEAQLAAARAALPADSGVSNLLRSLQSLGSSTSTTVSNVAVGAPAPVVPPAPATATGAATPPAQPASTTDTGVYSMSITAQVSGKVPDLTAFLQQLQSVQPRAVLVTQLSLGANTAGSTNGASVGHSSSLSLTMLAFMSTSGTSASGTATTGTP